MRRNKNRATQRHTLSTHNLVESDMGIAAGKQNAETASSRQRQWRADRADRADRDRQGAKRQCNAANAECRIPTWGGGASHPRGILPNLLTQRLLPTYCLRMCYSPGGVVRWCGLCICLRWTLPPSHLSPILLLLLFRAMVSECILPGDLELCGDDCIPKLAEESVCVKTNIYDGWIDMQILLKTFPLFETEKDTGATSQGTATPQATHPEPTHPQLANTTAENSRTDL